MRSAEMPRSKIPNQKASSWPMRNWPTLIFLSVSVLFSIGAMECGLRLFVNADDLLNPDVIADDRYGHRITPDSRGHDAWGFRNVLAPRSADILAVGDSMTYGVSARASESWPSWLARFSGRSVYNAGVGGYGPVEYVKIVSDFVPRLKPTTVIVGLYLGNDVWDAWFKCQNFIDSFTTVEQCNTPDSKAIIANMQNANFLGSIRNWLSQNSILYQSMKHSLGVVADKMRLVEDRARDIGDNQIVVNTAGIVIAFDQSTVNVDLHSLENAKGIRVMLFGIKELHGYCKKNGINCDYVLIPTKQSVYFPKIRSEALFKERQRLQQTYDDESKLRRMLIAYLQTNDMRYLDLLPTLQAAVDRTDRDIYRENFDGHPNGAGYRAIAVAICDRLVGGCDTDRGL